MRKLFLLSFLFLSITSIKSQQITVEGGKTISLFDYENSQGESLENLQSSNHTYLSLGYRKSIFTDRLFINLNGDYREYGTIGSDMDFDNYFEWDLSYLGLNLAFDYEIFKPGNFTIFIKASAGAEFLIQGTQTLNNQVFNLTDEEDFDSAIYVLRGGLGMQYRASPTLSVFTQYMYGTSSAFKDVQGNLKINSHNLGIGLLIDILNKQETTSTVDSKQLEKLQQELESNSEKIAALELENAQTKTDLENKLAEQEQRATARQKELDGLRSSISDALSPYKGNEVTIEERNGRIYVMLKDDLLFRSGSANLDQNGVQLVNDFGDFLAKNPELSIVIEGHTDDSSFTNSSTRNNNWDLSAKRATGIVHILEKNKDIDLSNLVVVGRAQYDPIADNTTADSKAKNRRITIILSPKLDELFKMTNN